MNYRLLIKHDTSSRHYLVSPETEALDLARIKRAAGGNPVACEYCLNEQGKGRICLFRDGDDNKAGARRWPGAQHVCERFRGEPVTAFRELPMKDIDVAKLCGTKEGSARFRLVLSNPLAPKKRSKLAREKVISGFAARVASRSRTVPPLPARNLGGALVVMLEEAGFNVHDASVTREFKDGFGMMSALESAFLRTPALMKSMRHPVLFPETFARGTNLRQEINSALNNWSFTRNTPARALLVGRLQCYRRDSANPGIVSFQLTGMGSDWVQMDEVLWDYWGPPKGKVSWFRTGAETELVVICRVSSSEGTIRASDTSFVPVDCYGMPFPESNYEPKGAKLLRDMGLSFAKPCHNRFHIDERLVWPDFVLKNKHGNTVVIEVDPGGYSEGDEKFTKRVLYEKYGIVVISWDPRRQPMPLLDWNEFTRAGELF